MSTTASPVLLSRLRVFAAVAESGSLTAAARDLGLSKSAVSRQVTALEEQLGVRLLVRSTRSLRLTEAGKVCMGATRRIVQEVRNVQELLSEMEARPLGTLRMGAPVAFGRRHVAPLVAEFSVEHPRVLVDLTLDDRRVDLLREEMDLVVRVGDLEDSELRGRRVGLVSGGLVASEDYVRRHGRPDGPRALSEHRLLAYSLSQRPDRWTLCGPSGNESVFFEPVARSNSGEVLRVMAEHGVGIAALPDFFTEEAIAAGRLLRILPQWSTPSVGVWVLTPPGRRTSIKVRAMSQWLSERLAERLGASEEGRRSL